MQKLIKPINMSFVVSAERAAGRRAGAVRRFLTGFFVVLFFLFAAAIVPLFALFQFFQDLIRKLRHRSGTERQYKIAFFNDLRDFFGGGIQ